EGEIEKPELGEKEGVSPEIAPPSPPSEDTEKNDEVVIEKHELDEKEQEKYIDEPELKEDEIVPREMPPPPPPPPPISRIKGYDAEELKKEIKDLEFLEKERTPEELLTKIKEERKLLEWERETLKEEIEQKERIMRKKVRKVELEEEGEEEEEEKTSAKPSAIKSFAKERRKRKEMKRFADYLFIGEYILLLVLVMAFLYAEGISFDPIYLPIESSIYLIIVFLLIIKVERFYFRFLNMKYSGTLQRKVIGVEHFKAIEIPPMMLTTFVIAMFLIPITSEIINLVVDMISLERQYIPFSSGFVFNLAMLFCASLVLSILWLLFLKRYNDKVITPELEKISEPFVIEDVFVITNSGLLINHLARESNPDVDDDLLSSMLTAVKEFVKDSFGNSSEEGELDELQYGKLRVIIEYGKHVYIAAVVKGQESMDLRPYMKRILKQIQRKFGRTFDTWDGDLAKMRGIGSLTQPLIKVQ
ncbi:MAG: hypothetical protein JSV09_01940, partial [Thermoplasmata archaeon]